MNEWVKCSDRMPGVGASVLITAVMDLLKQHPYTWVGTYSDEDGGEWLIGDDALELDQVTHWMPLPEPAVS